MKETTKKFRDMFGGGLFASRTAAALATMLSPVVGCAVVTNADVAVCSLEFESGLVGMLNAYHVTPYRHAPQHLRDQGQPLPRGPLFRRGHQDVDAGDAPGRQERAQTSGDHRE